MRGRGRGRGGEGGDVEVEQQVVTRRVEDEEVVDHADGDSG